jgi:hypothetical protein
VAFDYADPGAPTSRLTPIIRGKLLQHGSPAVAVVALGGNDGAPSAEAYLGSLQAFLRELRGGGVREIIGAGPAAVRGEASEAARAAEIRHQRVAGMQEALLPQLGVTWVDSRGLTRTGHRTDGVHFTAAGYHAWAEALVDAVIDADPVKREEEGQRRRRGVVGLAVGLSLVAVVAGIFVAVVKR